MVMGEFQVHTHTARKKEGKHTGKQNCALVVWPCRTRCEQDKQPLGQLSTQRSALSHARARSLIPILSSLPYFSFSWLSPFLSLSLPMYHISLPFSHTVSLLTNIISSLKVKWDSGPLGRVSGGQVVIYSCCRWRSSFMLPIHSRDTHCKHSTFPQVRSSHVLQS